MPRKQKHKPVHTTKSTNLHERGTWAIEMSSIPEDKLGEAIAGVFILKEQLTALERLECAFQEVVEGFRKLETRYLCHDDGNIYVSVTVYFFQSLWRDIFVIVIMS